MRIALAALLLFLLACSGGRGEVPPWAASAARKHAQADALLERGETAQAQSVLESILSEAAPALGRPASEAARILLQDTYFRLSRIAHDEQRDADAARLAGEGLSLGRADDLYTANLWLAHGAASEALQQPQRALEDYARALQINERLLRETLENP